MSKHLGSSVDKFYAEESIFDQTREVTSAQLPRHARRCWVWMLMPLRERIREWSLGRQVEEKFLQTGLVESGLVKV